MRKCANTKIIGISVDGAFDKRDSSALMQVNNPIKDKSYAFALEAVKLCLNIQQEKREYILTKQLLKSGTSIGANVEEAQQPQSRADFTSKMSIALKESYESRYWLRLIRDSGLASTDQIEPLLKQVDEIIRLLVAITMKSKSQA